MTDDEFSSKNGTAKVMGRMSLRSLLPNVYVITEACLLFSYFLMRKGAYASHAFEPVKLVLGRMGCVCLALFTAPLLNVSPFFACVTCQHGGKLTFSTENLLLETGYTNTNDNNLIPR